MRTIIRSMFGTLACVGLLGTSARGDFIQFGDRDLCNTGSYSSDPTAGATLQGLAAGTVTYATKSFGHGYPFSPSPGDYPGTDQIYVGSVQTASHDGSSNSASRLNGPQVITMDYSSLISPGHKIDTLTLGIAADDFQFKMFGQPFSATINGVANTSLANALKSLNQTGPYEQFLTVGIDPAILAGNNKLTLSINEGGDGGDGWAVDFLTVGVTSSVVPEPASIVSMAMGILGLIIFGSGGRMGKRGHSGS